MNGFLQMLGVHRLGRYWTQPRHLINTGALARWNDALRLKELFQQFVLRCEKPLKRLRPPSSALHRAEAPVLMRFSKSQYGISSLNARDRVLLTGALAVLAISALLMVQAHAAT